MIDRRILTAAIARQTKYATETTMLVRGSYVTGLWVGVSRRNCDDLDFVAVGHDDPKLAGREMIAALRTDLNDGIVFDTANAQVESIFADTDFPGVRILAPCIFNGQSSQLQVDIGFNDPIPLPAVMVPIKSAGYDLQFLSVAPELGFGWKLHGLIEREGYSWRPKDLADLWLMVRHSELDPAKLKIAVDSAMDSRDAPPWRLNRLLRCEMGTSRGSIRRWRKFRRDYPECELPESLAQVVADVAEFVRQHSGVTVHPLPTDHHAPRLPEMRQLSQMVSGVRTYHWFDGGAIFVNERQSKKANTLGQAETKAKFRQQVNRLETRGITFAADGTLLSRPYANFKPIDQLTQDEFVKAEVLEKLDGSLVFPTASESHGNVWRTRRGTSQIANDASDFATSASADYDGLIVHCQAKRHTPLFEWCSRKRWIVMDHPVDRLVLTGIRDNISGSLVGYTELLKLASQFGVECVKRYDVSKPLKTWIDEIEDWTNREGCIVRLENGSQYKLKSRWYRLLHRTVEGHKDDRDRARWELILRGMQSDLIKCSLGREINLATYVSRVEAAISQYAVSVREFVANFGDRTDANRKRLAIALQPRKPIFRHLSFAVFDGLDIHDQLNEAIIWRCQERASFAAIAAEISSPQQLV